MKTIILRLRLFSSLLYITVIVLCLFARCSNCSVPPNRTVYYTNERAVFECNVKIPNIAIWFLNGTAPPSNPVEPYLARFDAIRCPHNFIKYVLTMDASPKTNNTRIVCQDFNEFELIGHNKPTIVLSVQGLLGSPGVTFVNDSQSVNITLDKPYCLPGAEISHYGSELHVPNQNMTITTTFPNPEISFVFSEYNISRCDSQNIRISLCAYNRAGEGEFSHLEVFVPSDMNYCDQLPMSDPKDLDCSLLYLLAALVAVLLVAMSVLVCVFIFVKRAVKRTSTDQEKGVGHTNMSQNASYVSTIPMKQNKSYEESPHVYEMVKNPPYSAEA